MARGSVAVFLVTGALCACANSRPHDPYTATEAPTEHVIAISDDKGGDIISYGIHYESLAKSGSRFAIDGECASACTQVLGLGPERVCATHRAALLFHKGSSDFGTALLWAKYPRPLQAWLNRRGGLTDHVISLHWPETKQFIPDCSEGNGE